MTSNCLPKTKKNWKQNTDCENIYPRYRNGIWHRKCTLIIMKNGKRHITKGIELQNQDKIRTLGGKRNVQILGHIGS